MQAGLINGNSRAVNWVRGRSPRGVHCLLAGAATGALCRTVPPRFPEPCRRRSRRRRWSRHGAGRFRMAGPRPGASAGRAGIADDLAGFSVGGREFRVPAKEQEPRGRAAADVPAAVDCRRSGWGVVPVGFGSPTRRHMWLGRSGKEIAHEYRVRSPTDGRCPAHPTRKDRFLWRSRRTSRFEWRRTISCVAIPTRSGSCMARGRSRRLRAFRTMQRRCWPGRRSPLSTFEAPGTVATGAESGLFREMGARFFGPSLARTASGSVTASYS